MRLTCLTFADITPLDLIGPLQVLARVPGLEIDLVAPHSGFIDTQIAGVHFSAREFSAQQETDYLLVPGGPGVRPLLQDEALIAWLKAIDKTTTLTCSVCTGALLLAKAGLLDGRKATTHWASDDVLENYGAHYVPERIVEDGKYMSAAGVSAGIDMALLLAARLTGESVAKAIQLSIEYDPQPPFDSGSPRTASKETIDMVRRAIASYEQE